MQQELLNTRDNNNQIKTMPLKDFEAKKQEINELLNSKAKELKELGLLDKLGEFVGIQTENAKEREKQIIDLKTQALDNKLEFKDLPNALKDEYYNKAETSIFNPLKTKNEIAKQDYQKDLQRKEILQKTSKELTDSDKELIDNDSGFFNYALDAITGKSEVEKLKEYKEKEKAKDITKDLQKSWNLFNNLRKDKDAFSLFASEDLQLREKYQNEFKNIAKINGFDDVVYNEKHEPFVRKGDKFYKINDRFFDNFLNFLSANKFSLAGSLIGVARGAKAGKNLGALGLLGGAIVGGALGSAAGGATDAIAGNAFLNREQKADEIIRHALSEGALSLATDTLVLGAGKFIQKAINPRNIFNIGANVSTSGLYALGKHIVTGNAKGAERILNETISENERQAVRELVKQFGGELRLTKADGSKYREELVKKVGEDSKILKGYDALRDASLLQSQAKKQEAFIQAIRSDETGNAIAFLSEAANSSPIANANLKKILNKTTENLKDSLRQFDLKDYEVKSIFDNLEQGTKESYEKALDGIIGKLYDNSYKTNLRESIQDITAFEKFTKELREQGKFDPTANSFLNQIEKNIYSPDGVTFEQLRNARQMINAYERNVKDPSTLGYIKKISAQFLREDIDKGIENILKQNTQAYEKLSDLNKTAISDYKNMKQTLELVDSAKIRDREITKEKAIENLIKVIQAQGEKDLSNYALLTKGLSEQDKEKLELSMLNALMEKSIKQGENLKVFDSTHFFNKLNEFRNEVFTTPKANQYIDIAKGFDKLFRNDATIASKINYATTQDIKSPLATSLEGAFNQKLTQRLVGTIVRNIPTTYIFKKLDELSGGAALKYHIQRALERSHSISEFSKRLEISAKNSKFSNATMRKIEEITQGVQSAKENITKQKKALQDAITPLKQFGQNYAEFVLRPKEALEKLLQEKNGQVAGAAFRDDLGGIDFVWGKDGKDGYGLAHILEKREKQYTRLGLNAEQIKERTDELLKSIPEVIENGTLFKDDLGRVSVQLKDMKVGLTNQWFGNDLKNHLIVTSYERDEKVLRELETRSPLSNDYKGNSNYSALNLNENNPTKESLTSQEPQLSILEKSQLEKEKKLESERLAKAEKEYAQKIKNKEEAELRDKIRAQKNATLGKSELDREISKGENIPYKEPENAHKTSVSLNDDEIYPLKFVIVNKSDLKPNFKNTGTQTRTAVDSKKVEEIAERFDPKLMIGRGGFDDLPIILPDGQVISGNHRIQGMLNFNAESRKKYEQALKENFNIRLKPNELLVRMPEQELNDKEIFKLASKSNENRANSFSDTLLSAMSSYNDKLKHLPHKFESDSVENLANQVARVLERDAKIPSHTQVENANLSLLSHYARNTLNNSFLEVFDNAYKNLDREQFKAFKEMFANNSGNFHNLNNDTTIKNFTISPYLTDALDTTAKMLESGNRSDNFSKLAHDIDYLVNTTDENGMNAFIKENKDAYNSVISQLLGSSFARFLRLENPSAQFYEFLTKAKDQMIENTSNVFTGTSKPISQINVFDFIKYGIESGRSSKESMELLDLLPKLEKKFNAHEKFLQGSKK
uniref:Phage protein n=1 Tax=Helicobacter pylori TaxID=210 RepID=A0A060CUM3_HELPX|nr:phage protein [Helicobacter pylori]